MQKLIDQPGTLIFVFIGDEAIQLIERRNTTNRIKENAAAKSIIINGWALSLSKTLQLRKNDLIYFASQFGISKGRPRIAANDCPDN
jgi:hypothetical protein